MSQAGKRIRDLFGLVDRDLQACRTPNLAVDWRFNIAYNAALQAATAALAAAGSPGREEEPISVPYVTIRLQFQCHKTMCRAKIYVSVQRTTLHAHQGNSWERRSLTFETEPGRGTTFHIQLPIGSESEREEEID